MSKERANVGWGFWLRWVLASFLGFVVGGAIGGSAGGALGEGFAGMSTVGALLGAILGTMQWLVLRKYAARTGWWALATAFGYFLAGIATEWWVFRRVPYPEAVVPAIASFEAVGGILGGTMQWLILREHVARAGWWVVASIVGVTVSIGIVWIVSMMAGQTEAAIGSGFLLGMGVGVAIPGIALVWLLRQSRSQALEGLATTAH